MTDQIFEKLRELGYSTVSEDHYRFVDLWKQWFSGHVNSFHDYKVFNGLQQVQCHKVTAGLAKNICESWADRLMNEKVSITLEGEKEQAFFDEVCRQNSFQQMMNRYQELSFALGCGAVVARLGGIAVDEQGRVREKAQKLYPDFVAADGIFPLSWQGGAVHECAFMTEFNRDGDTYCYLQLHVLDGAGLYNIQNHLFKRENDCLTEIDLDDVPGFEHVPDVFLTGSEEPLFILFRPNIVNNLDMNCPLGISVFANAIDQLMTCDNIFDSLNSEFLLGRKRIMVKPEAVSNKDGTPKFAVNELAFYVLPEDAGNEAVIQELKAELRVQEHLTGLETALSMLAIKCGFGPGHWELDRRQLGLHTATEVISTNSAEFRTLKKHELVLENALISLARIILKIGNIWFGMHLREDVQISIDFDDTIIEDEGTKFDRDLKMLDKGILAPEEFRAVWMNEDAKTAKEAIAGITKKGDIAEDGR